MLEALEQRTLLSVWYVDDGALPGGTGGVSDPFNTIQAGINAAANTDTVEVAAGTYNEVLTWDAKDISLIGAGAAVTIVDPDGAGRCLTIVDVPGPANLEAFTLTHGSAGFGGGMYLAHSSPTIENCTITANTSSSSGGGMYITDSSPALTGNMVSQNTSGRDGGGICATNHSNPTLTDNRLINNFATLGGGGAIFLDASSGTYTRNEIGTNHGKHGGGLAAFNGSDPKLDANTFIGNDATMAGGAVYLWNSYGILTNNVIAANTSSSGGAV